MWCSPGPAQMWCLPACLSSEHSLSASSVLRLLFYVEAASDWSLSLAEVRHFGGMGEGLQGEMVQPYVEQIVTVSPLICRMTSLGEESKQVMEVVCWSRLVVQPVFSITVADASTQTSYDPIQGHSADFSA